MDKPTTDQDRSKGAVEQDQQNEGRNTSMQGQLGHQGRRYRIEERWY
jgi:hypothetical protein